MKNLTIEVRVVCTVDEAHILAEKVFDFVEEACKQDASVEVVDADTGKELHLLLP